MTPAGSLLPSGLFNLWMIRQCFPVGDPAPINYKTTALIFGHMLVLYSECKQAGQLIQFRWASLSGVFLTCSLIQGRRNSDRPHNYVSSITHWSVPIPPGCVVSAHKSMSVFRGASLVSTRTLTARSDAESDFCPLFSYAAAQYLRNDNGA